MILMMGFNDDNLDAYDEEEEEEESARIAAASFRVPIHISAGSASVIAPLRGRFKQRCN